MRCLDVLDSVAGGFTLPLFKAGQFIHHWVASSYFWAPLGRCWDTMDWGLSHDKLVSQLSTLLGHPGFKVSVRLLLSSCLSMYTNPSVQSQ